jgi:hypothetical protein
MDDKHFPNEFDPNAPAWWISPEGKILAVKKGECHIKKVIENPKAFGYTLEQIEKIYADYGEPLGSEKEARGQIIKDILSKGWIRIRDHKTYYTIQLAALSTSAKDFIIDWAILMEEWVGPLPQVTIKTEAVDQFRTIATLTADAKMDEGKHKGKTLIPINSVFDF